MQGFPEAVKQRPQVPICDWCVRPSNDATIGQMNTKHGSSWGHSEGAAEGDLQPWRSLQLRSDGNLEASTRLSCGEASVRLAAGNC